MRVAPRPPWRERLPELLLATAVVVLGGAMLWQTTGIRISPAYSKVGPRVIPYLVGGGLVLIGLWLAIEVRAGRVTKASDESEDGDPSLPTDWRTAGLLAVPLVAYLFLIERAGFVIASALLFVGAALAMGSRRIVRDVAAGVGLAIVVYVVFTDGLDLRLPAGILEGFP